MKIPKFKNDKEAAEFWDTHSAVDYLDDMEDAPPVELDPKLTEAIRERSKMRLVSLRLRQSQIEAAKKIAREKDIPYQTLIRSWISQAIRSETSR